MPLPSQEVQSSATAALTALITAFESHPAWKPVSGNEPATPSHRTLFFLWDFASRSRYILSELQTVADGKDAKHPEQLPKQEGVSDPKKRAESLFTDVLSRSAMLEKLVATPAMLRMMGVQPVDFGDDIKKAARDVNTALKG